MPGKLDTLRQPSGSQHWTVSGVEQIVRHVIVSQECGGNGYARYITRIISPKDWRTCADEDRHSLSKMNICPNLFVRFFLSERPAHPLKQFKYTSKTPLFISNCIRIFTVERLKAWARNRRAPVQVPRKECMWLGVWFDFWLNISKLDHQYVVADRYRGSYSRCSCYTYIAHVTVTITRSKFRLSAFIQHWIVPYSDTLEAFWASLLFR